MNLLRYVQGERPGMRAGQGIELPESLPPELFDLLYLGITIQTQVRLADISYYQGGIDFALMRQVLDGVIIRAGQRNWVDCEFVTNWQAAKQAGLPRGTYWLYDSREDPKKQAALWWSLVCDDPAELVYVADLEESYGGPYGTPENFKAFILEFLRLSGLPDSKFAVYSGFFWWNERVGDDIFFRRFSLWLAWYAPMAVVRVPEPWAECDLLFWQYTCSGDGFLYGVSSREIDLNWFNGTAAEYSQRFGLGAPDPQEEDMGEFSGTAKLTSTPNVRVRKPFPGGVLDVNGVTIAGIMPGQSFRANNTAQDALGREWVHVTAYGDRPTDGWSAGWLLTYTLPPPDPEPEPVLPDLPYTVTLGDDITYERQTISGVLKPK